MLLCELTNTTEFSIVKSNVNRFFRQGVKGVKEVRFMDHAMSRIMGAEAREVDTTAGEISDFFKRFVREHGANFSKALNADKIDAKNAALIQDHKTNLNIVLGARKGGGRNPYAVTVVTVARKPVAEFKSDDFRGSRLQQEYMLGKKD